MFVYISNLIYVREPKLLNVEIAWNAASRDLVCLDSVDVETWSHFVS